MKLPVLTLENKKVGEAELDEALFGLTPRADILHRMTRYHLARRRTGSRKTKRRGEIRGSTRKIYRQKGTGGARHGSRRVNIFRGGGKAHGPLVRDHGHDLPKKFRRLALKHALSAKAKSGAIVIVEKASAKTHKTAALRPQMETIGIAKALLVEGSAEMDKNFSLASRNIPGFSFVPLAALNVYDILAHETLALTQEALKALPSRFADSSRKAAP